MTRVMVALGALAVSVGVVQVATSPAAHANVAGQVNVLGVQVGNFNDQVAPSENNSGAQNCADGTDCSPVTFPSSITNAPDTDFGNTPCAQFSAGCDSPQALGTWVYEIEPTNSGGLNPGSNVMLHAPSGTTFPSDKSDYYVVPLCNAPSSSSLPANNNTYSNAFDFPKYVNDWVCSNAVDYGETAAYPLNVFPSSSGDEVTVSMPFGVAYLNGDGTDFGDGNTFGIFIADVVNPPALPQTNGAITPYPAQSFNVTTSQEPTFPGFPQNGLSFTNSTAQYSSLTASQTTIEAGTTQAADLTATVVDQYGNPVPNENVYVQPENGSASLAPGFTPPTSTQGDGTALFEYVDTKAETVTFQGVDYTAGTTLANTVRVTWVPGPPVIGFVDVSKTTVLADGTDSATVTVGMADQYDNPNVGSPIALLALSSTDHPAGAGTFTDGIVAQPNGADTSCVGAIPITGTGCGAPATTVNIDGQPEQVSEVTFIVSDPHAEDVKFGFDDLSNIGGAELQSAPFTFNIDFAAAQPVAAQSTILPVTQSVVADGTHEGTITVTLRDADKSPVPGLAVSLTPQGPAQAMPTAVEIPNSTSGCAGTQAPAGTTDCNGHVSFHVTDGAVENISYLASYSGTAFGYTSGTTVGPISVSGTVGPATIDFVAGVADAGASSVTASPTSALANGTAASTITVTLKDGDGHPAAGRAVTLTQPGSDHSTITPVEIPDSTSGCATQAPAGTSDCSGEATFSVTDTTPESVTYTATDTTDSPPGGVVIGQQATVGFTTTPTVATSTIVAAPTSVPADGSAFSLVTVTLKDASGNPIAGKTICLNQAAGSVASSGSCAAGSSTVTPVVITGSGCGTSAPAGSTDCHGQAEFDVTSTSGSTLTYGFTDLTDYPNGPPIGPTTQVTFTPLPTEAGRSTVVAVPTLRLAGTAGAAGTSTVTVTLNDASGTPIAGHDVSLQASSGTSTVTAVSGTTTDGNGQVTFDVTDSAPEVVTYTATDTTASPNATVIQTASVTFEPDEASVSTIGGAPTAVANGGTSGAGIDLVTVTLDPGVPLVGHQVSLLESGGGNEHITSVAIPVAESGCATPTPAGTTDCNGQSRFAVTDTTVEQVTLGAADNTTTTTLVATTSVNFLAPAPVVTSLTPVSGLVSGGTTVTIDGSGLTAPGQATTVEFGSVPATGVSCTATECTVTAPAAGAPGPVDVVVTTSGGTSTPATPGADVYTYVNAAPTVTGVTPDHGLTTGGVVVTVDGTNFGTTATTTVSFGTATVPVLSVNGSGTELTARNPSDVAGTVDVTVTVGDQTSAVNRPSDQFTYVVASTPTVSSISPSVGPITGGTAVTISGSNLGTATAVDFGSVSATSFTVNPDGTVTAVTPHALAGLVHVTVTTPSGTSATGSADEFTYQVDPGTDSSYWLVASDGGIFAFGDAAYYGSTGDVPLNKPIVGMTPAADGRGYWLVASDGGIFAFGDAGFYGSTGSMHLNAPIVGMAATPDGKGYWLVASDGGIFAFGDAGFYGSPGSLHLNAPIAGMAATPDGNGYTLAGADGGIFTYGDAIFEGSAGALHLNKPIVGMAPTSDGHGYWLVASDGGIFNYGDAPMDGSAGNIALNQPIVGIAATPDGKGYWLDATDGGIFSYGDAGFSGSMGGTPLNQPMVGMAAL
ncbi:MAG TPA: Ig-like domain-containing protein [Acidimicrobiales bacterium]|nr:Ig-like domain-containing protein [Acidimicrobiales bacterium]